MAARRTAAEIAQAKVDALADWLLGYEVGWPKLRAHQRALGLDEDQFAELLGTSKGRLASFRLKGLVPLGKFREDAHGAVTSLDPSDGVPESGSQNHGSEAILGGLERLKHGRSARPSWAVVARSRTTPECPTWETSPHLWMPNPSRPREAAVPAGMVSRQELTEAREWARRTYRLADCDMAVTPIASPIAGASK